MRALLLALWPLILSAQYVPAGSVAPVGGGGGGTFAVVQQKYIDSQGSGNGGGTGTCANNATACTVTVSSIGAGHTLIAGSLVFRTAGSSTLSSVTGGETWTHCAGTNGCAFGNTGWGWLDASYVLSATGSETSFTCNVSAAAGGYLACFVIELSYSGSSVSFDTSNGGNNTSCTSCSGVALTLGGTDAIVQIGIPEDALTAINLSYTGTFNSGAGVAYLINTTNGTAPTWTANAGQMAKMAIAFKGN